MGILDFVEAYEATSGDELIPDYKGTFGVTIGAALQATFGNKYSYDFGSSVQLVCDLEDLLVQKVLGKALPGLGGLLAGIRGRASFVYGSKTYGHYVGEYISISRGTQVKKVGGTIEQAPAEDADVEEASDPVDDSVKAAVYILSVITILMAAGLALAVHFRYPKFGSTDEQEPEGYGKLPELLRILCLGLSDRLMEFIKQLELAGSWTALGKQYLTSAARLLQIPVAPMYYIAALFLTAGITIATFCSTRAVSNLYRAGRAMDDATKALVELG